MFNFTISIFRNKIFFEIIREIKLFSKFKVEHYEDLDLCLKKAKENNHLVIFFEDNLKKIKINDFPSILILNSLTKRNIFSEEFRNILKVPFSIFDFEKKVISILAQTEFRKNSVIRLNDYTIDKNERKIKKNNLELQLSEKEIDFLILFSKTKKPISKNLVLKNAWNYSETSETHTVETHIHRLRKKILEKFGDGNFIKNNDKGYYI